MDNRERIRIPEIAEKSGVDEDDVSEVLLTLIREGWLMSEYVVLNERSSGNLDLPE